MKKLIFSPRVRGVSNNNWTITIIGGVIAAVLSALIIALFTRPVPITPTLAYEFLVDTSDNMKGQVNNIPKFQLVTDAIQAIADTPGLDAKLTWRGLRLMGGGTLCNQTQLVTGGTDISTSDFVQPLHSVQPQGSNAYEVGIHAMPNDLAASEVTGSNIKVVFIILGALKFDPCRKFPIAEALGGFKSINVSATLCMFGINTDIMEFEQFHKEMLAAGIDCVYNVDQPEVMTELALDIMERLIRKQTGLEEPIPLPFSPTPISYLKPTDTPAPTLTFTPSNTPIEIPTLTFTPTGTNTPIVPVLTLTVPEIPTSPISIEPTKVIQSAASPASPITIDLVVNIDSANLRSGPGLEYPVIGAGLKDQKLPIIAQSQSTKNEIWYEIQRPNGQMAWIASSVAKPDSDGIIPTAQSIPFTPIITLPLLSTQTQNITQVCNPGEWNAICASNDCPTDHVSQCNEQGTGWTCVWNPAECPINGGPASCSMDTVNAIISHMLENVPPGPSNLDLNGDHIIDISDYSLCVARLPKK